MSTPLSRIYDTPTYRARPNTRPVYRDAPIQAPCDECVAVQHETHGKFGPRLPARVRRILVGAPDLRLCGRHVQAWRDRDAMGVG